MPAFLSRCPASGTNVQTWIADDPTERDDYEAITCLACQRAHILSRKTGKVLGEDDNTP